MKNLVLGLGLFALTLSTGQHVSAAPVTLTFSSTVTSSSVTGVSVGQVLSGTLTLDPDAAFSPIAGTGGQAVTYTGAVLGFSSTEFGNIVPESSWVSVYDNYSDIEFFGPFSTQYTYIDGWGVEFDAPGGDNFQIIVYDIRSVFDTPVANPPTGIVSGVSLLEAPNLAAARNPSFDFRSTGDGFFRAVQSDLTRIEVAAVPLPAPLVLLGLGLAGLGVLRHRGTAG